MLMNKIKLVHDFLLSGATISTDTRSITKGDIFFALKGERFNGNKYAKKAIDAGAILAVIDERDFKLSEQYVVVDHVLKFLQALANYHRSTFKGKVIALTGSNGKTTTKELIAKVLQSTFRITVTKGNLNNHIGVPLTILNAKQDDDYVIIEMGANHQGEIAALCKIAEPDYGLITNIGKAHLEGFGGIEGVKKGKGEMYAYLKNAHKTILVNKEDPTLLEMLGEYDSIIEVVPSDIILEDDKRFLKLKALGQSVETNLIGEIHIQNIAIAIAIGRYFGVSEQSILNGVSSYIPDNNRSEIVGKDDRTFILDAYNSNPTSARFSIDAFDKSSFQNKVVVLGDMLELGTESEAEHKSVYSHTQSKTFHLVILVGEIYHNLYGDNDFVFLNIDELKSSNIWKQLRNCTILLKGSRALQLERLVTD